MNKQTFEDARAAWRAQFALQTFKSVRAGVEAMLERGQTVTHWFAGRKTVDGKGKSVRKIAVDASFGVFF
jgi:hypothetical protein